MSEENPYAGQGPVLLDIGGDIGALVVAMPAGMDGVEVEIRPVFGPGLDHAHLHDHAHPHEHEHGPSHEDPHAHLLPHLLHVAVVSRPVGSGVLPSLVFPELTAGRYELYRRPSGPVELSAEVIGGEVTTARWPPG